MNEFDLQDDFQEIHTTHNTILPITATKTVEYYL